VGPSLFLLISFGYLFRAAGILDEYLVKGYIMNLLQIL
jgi:hypothetical protein